MKKIKEYTYGSHIYMELELDNKIYEIDCYILQDGTLRYRTTADNNPVQRQKVIDAFNKLY